MAIDYTYTHLDHIGADGSLGKPITFKKECAFFAGKDVEIIVRRKRAKRSDEQNRLYYSYVRLIADHTGYSYDEMHQIIGFKFRLVEKVDEKTGEVFRFIQSTSKMNKLEMADHCTEIQKWCKDTFGFELPVPGENWQIRFCE